MVKITGVSIKKMALPSVQGYKGVMPHMDRSEISLTVNGPSSYANAIHRTAKSELPIWVMDTDMSNVSGTDTKVVADFVITRLNLIPIVQSIAEDPTFRAVLDYHNTSDEIKVVHSCDIKFEIGGKPIDSGRVCDGSYPIVAIRPNLTIRIDNIQVRRGYGYEHASFQPIGSSYYREVTRDEKYEMTLRTLGTISEREFLPIVFSNIIERVSNVLDVLEQVEEEDITTESVSYTFTSETNIIEIAGETHTIGQLLARAIYDVDKSVSNVSSKVPHPTSRRVIIRYKGSPDLARKACRHIIGAFTDFTKSVKK